MSGRRWRTWEDFLQPGSSDVLRNRLGLNDAAELARAERGLTAARIAQLAATPLGGAFDLAHLQAMHRHIFQDVYEWAGVIRPFTLAKGGDEFCRPEFIESAAADIFGRLHDAGLLRDVDAEQFTVGAANLLADLNSLHPFREGNGRTQRAFLSQLAATAHHPLVWPSGAEQRNITASIAAHRGNSTGLRALIQEALTADNRPGSNTLSSAAQLARQAGPPSRKRNPAEPKPGRSPQRPRQRRDPPNMSF